MGDTMRFVFILVIAFNVILIGSAIVPAPAHAWGKFGHLTVCDLAYRNLTPTSRNAMNDLLQSRTGGITVPGQGKMPDRHYTSFNMGCLEEDAIPRHHEDDHFINVARDVTQILSACPASGECILSGISRDFAILKDPSKSRQDRVFALMALGHWIGDIHQPLHISFADDKGGNGIAIALAGRCGSSTEGGVENLHAVWDKCLLDAGLFERVRQRDNFNPNWSRFTITYRAVDTLQANTTLTEERSLVGIDPTVWANESYRVTLAPGTLYCVYVGSNCQYSSSSVKKSNPIRVQPISQAYLTSNQAIAQERIKRAGFRLAHLINLALDPSYSVPVRDPGQPAS